jgi:plastocyanin
MPHRRLRAGVAALACLLLVAGCAGTGAPVPTAAAPTSLLTAEPTTFAGQVMQISAKSLLFSPTSVTVKAGAEFEIVFDNQDEFESHAIYVTPGKRPIEMQSLEQYEDGPYPFKGEYVQAHKSITYHVGALSPGAYQFFCPPHRDMVISVTVE